MILSVISSSGCQVPVEVRLANTDEEVEKALRLRYQIFVREEMADLENNSQIEMDKYDPYCQHLIVKRLDTHDVIGTYRLLLGRHALNGIGLYSEEEFDLTLFQPCFYVLPIRKAECSIKEKKSVALHIQHL